MKQISGKLGLSHSTVNHCLVKNNIKKRLISKAIEYCYITRFNKKPFDLKKHLSNEEKKLKIAGIMIYLGEGVKEGNSVVLTSSDPKVIKIFLQFLRIICGVSEDRLKILLHTYPDHSEKELKNFWSKITDIPKNQFNKTHSHEGKKGTYKKKSLYGTVSLRYNDTRLLKQILFWIDEYAKNGVCPPSSTVEQLLCKH